MRKKEQRLWDRMRTHVGQMAHLERIENLVGVGIPDVISLARGHVTPCELKSVEFYPARETTRVFGDKGLNQDQKNWHLTWTQNGGTSLIIGSVGLDLYVIPGTHADYFNDYTRRQLAMNAIATDWPGLIYFLRTHHK